MTTNDPARVRRDEIRKADEAHLARHQRIVAENERMRSAIRAILPTDREMDNHDAITVAMSGAGCGSAPDLDHRPVPVRFTSRARG